MKAFLLTTTFVCITLMAIVAVTLITGEVPFLWIEVPLSSSIVLGMVLFIAVYSNIQCLSEINETKN